LHIFFRFSLGQIVTMLHEFLEFIKRYGVIGLAIAVIIGGKLNTLISTVVDGILMPVLTFFMPGGSWRTATVQIGQFTYCPALFSEPQSIFSSLPGLCS
jgi:large-conductance mechanosensitive channel